ncbi:MAG: glycosyl hydrolase-related protein [Lachnospiraceae bacterium]|nr:glycosyl hydrolase-related protein [Lachnospiraceae bacterium]
MKLGRQWEERLKLWEEAFAPNLYHELGTAPLEGFTTWEALSPKDLTNGQWEAFPEGRRWGQKWEYGWFRAKVMIPAEGAGHRILLHIGAGKEMLIFVNGREAGSIDRFHDFVELTACAKEGENFDILAEVYAGHGQQFENVGIQTRDAAPIPEPPEFQCRVERSHFGIWEEEIFQAYADYHTLYELWKALPESELRAMEIGEALKRFTCIADFEAEEPERSGSIRRARRELIPLLEKKNGDTVPEYTVFGQSHLDLAWLWTGAETRRKCARTYSNQLALMERYPEYRFLLCEPPILETLKSCYPDLYGRVKEKVKSGQFIPEGAVYVECDTNLAGAESLVRQFVLGKRWFRTELGAESRLAWLPDTFGFCGALPQIMAGCEVPYFATQKLLRADPECEPFPYNIFWWEGIDGTRVLSHIYKKNNAVFQPGALRERWEQDRNQREEISGLMFPFGYGDGGGGPTELMVETVRRCEDLEGAPRCRMEGPVSFFERLEPEQVKAVYYGELYLRWHRGTYTAQAQIKKGVRKAEYALREAEYLAGLLRLEGKTGDEDRLLQKLDSLWKRLLVQEFHDVLPGSSIQRVNEEAREALAEILTESRALAAELLEVLADGPACFNSLSWERKYRGFVLPSCGYVKFKSPENEGTKYCLTYGMRSDVFSDPADVGIKCPQTQCEEWSFPPENLLTGVDRTSEMPENGFTGVDGISETSENGFTGLSGNGETLDYENELYRVKIDSLGRIVSLTDRGTEYEYAAAPLNDWRLYQDVNVQYDAWEIGSMYESVPVALTGKHTCLARKDETGGLTITVERTERYFTAVQKICLYPDSPRIDFVTTIDWHERHRMLKADFPTTVYTKEVLEEIQFGYIRRPTHKSTGREKDLYETCHHKYAALTDGENGFALLNDCKYGLSAQDSRLSLTLLRSPLAPDMTADQGIHEFVYSILPFEGPFSRSRVTEEAYECNVAVTECGRRPGEGTATAVSYFQVESTHVVIETCKPAFDVPNGIVLRLYEAKGCAGMAYLTVPAQVKRVFSCNMLEEASEELEVVSGHRVRLSFHVFEIKTLLLIRT